MTKSKKITQPLDIKDLNFSVYIDNQVKNTPPTEDFLQQQIHKIYPKMTNEWVDSNIVSKCQDCSTKFGLFVRKHHCRACGGVYCSSCCYKYMNIPSRLLDVPKETTNIGIYFKNAINRLTNSFDESKSLVCNECGIKINNLLSIEYLIKICEFVSLPELYSCLMINKKWHNASVHCLSKFRNIQYKAPDYIYTKWECSFLWSNYEYLIGHNSWLSILIKSSFINTFAYNKINLLPELLSKYNIEKKINCWNLMCSRKCNLEMDQLEILDIIQYFSKIPGYNKKFWNNKEYMDLILNLIKYIVKNNPINCFDYLMPYISISLRLLIYSCEKYSSEYIVKILDLFSKQNVSLIDNFLMLLTLEYNYIKNINGPDKKNNSLTNYNPINPIGTRTKDYNFCLLVQNYLKNNLNPSIKSILSKTINVFTKLYNDRNNFVASTYSNLLPILYPFDTSYVITDILDIRELHSSSKPILVRVWISKIDSEVKIEKKFILKNDQNLRKENIVSSLIILLQNKLIQQMRRGRIEPFEPIPTYKIVMISNELGVIEFLDNCLTLKNISNKNYTLQNYILDNNKDIKIGIIKERFAKSLAISSCLSYVLGLGDRHANNIMVSNLGQIIHIDYGYILENPIHSSILNNPVIRISNEMIDFLGGWNSEYYQLFRNYIAKVFDIIRLYADIIINYYYILGWENMIDWEKFKKKLSDRFLNGMKFKDIEVVMLDVIESSTRSYSGAFIDLCNEYGGKIKQMVN